MDENGAIGLEEERRLAYVGITRARKNVHISFASSRRVHGQWQSAIPSRFVQELPAENIIEDMAQGMGIGRTSPAYISGASGLVGQQGYGPGWRRMADRQQQGTDNRFVAESSGAAFIRGDRVFHQKFGMGNVVNVEGDKLEISFDKAGHKKVVSGFVSKP
jgi:DNA helicase-2/ATP-dependent DNA helicase PcrA